MFATDASIVHGATSVITLTGSDVPVLTLQQLREQVGQFLPDDDGLLTDLQYAAIGVVSSLIGRPLMLSTRRAYYPVATSVMRLPDPLTANSTLAVVAVDDAGAETALDAPVVLQREPVGVIALATPLSVGVYGARVHVTYQSGYTAATDVPVPLQHAIRLLVAHYYQSRGDTTSVTQHAIPFGVKALCQPYSVRSQVS